MEENIIGLLWPKPKKYPRFLEIAGPGYPPTYLEFVQLSESRIAELEKDGHTIEKVVIDPDKMLTWCMLHRGKVETENRAAYAVAKLRSTYGKGPKVA